MSEGPSNDTIRDWCETAKADFIGLMLGRKLGGGMSRVVYECALDPNLVVKIEQRTGHFQNVVEWEMWNALSGMKAAQWLAPCRTISACGTVLLQVRTTPARKGELPERMPIWLTDFKQGNYGMLGGRLVCHDYGASGAILMSNAAGKRLQRADWWDVDRHG